jgi:hypothetical protein
MLFSSESQCNTLEKLLFRGGKSDLRLISVVFKTDVFKVFSCNIRYPRIFGWISYWN